MTKSANLTELQETLALLPKKQWDDVKRCVDKLSEVLLSYDEPVALLALATVGLTLQPEIEKQVSE